MDDPAIRAPSILTPGEEPVLPLAAPLTPTWVIHPMDADRFDALARTLTAAGSWRWTLAALGGVLGLLSLAGPDEAAAAKSAKCKPKCGECESCKRGNCRKTSASCPTGAPPRHEK
jgi:hypothetical protein